MPARIRPEVGKPIFNAVILLDCRFGRSFCTACFIVDLTLGAQQHFYCPTASRQVPTRLLVKFEDAAISLRGFVERPIAKPFDCRSYRTLGNTEVALSI